MFEPKKVAPPQKVFQVPGFPVTATYNVGAIALSTTDESGCVFLSTDGIEKLRDWALQWSAFEKHEKYVYEQEQLAKALASPKPGMYFRELFSFHLYILAESDSYFYCMTSEKASARYKARMKQLGKEPENIVGEWPTDGHFVAIHKDEFANQLRGMDKVILMKDFSTTLREVIKTVEERKEPDFLYENPNPKKTGSWDRCVETPLDRSVLLSELQNHLAHLEALDAENPFG